MEHAEHVKAFDGHAASPTRDVQRRRVFISAAEPSADAHGAALIRASRELDPALEFVGVCGPSMRDAGCKCVFDMSAHASMLMGAIRNVVRGARMLALCETTLRGSHFDACVVLDSPTLHLPLAARAHAAGVPVLYYIAPQMWAWGEWRIHKLRNNADRVACILPFEESYFRRQGVEATFVGHPLAERLANHGPDGETVARLRGDGAPVIGLLPGSRRHVVGEVLGGQLDTARRIAARIPAARFIVSEANERVAPIVRGAARECGLPLRIHSSGASDVIAASDLLLVASGTTALEVAFHRKPMVVMYNSSRLFYHLVARWLIRTEHLSLPNILAGRRIVPEFMPYFDSTAPIAEAALIILQDESIRRTMIAELDRVVAPLRDRRASEATARMLIELANTAH